MTDVKQLEAKIAQLTAFIEALERQRNEALTREVQLSATVKMMQEQLQKTVAEGEEKDKKIAKLEADAAPAAPVSNGKAHEALPAQA